MVKKDKETTEKEYNALVPIYEKLATNLKRDLESLIIKAGIETLPISYRIKTFDSLWGKKERKGYTEPLDETEDICGLRIVCFYPSDIEKLSDLIQTEFVVLEKTDKQELLDPDKFGYRSHHYIIKLKEEWLEAPCYRGLGDLKVELQVRTILMHAWADISHKLEYKDEEQVPGQFKRKLCQISALFEMADAQFDALREEKEEYREILLSEEAKKTGQFDVEQPLNIDSLQAFLDFYFPDRYGDYKTISELLGEIIEYGINIEDLVLGYERVKNIITEFEKEEFGEEYEKGIRCHKEGVTRMILDLTHDHYWDNRFVEFSGDEDREKYRDLVVHWRKRL